MDRLDDGSGSKAAAKTMGVPEDAPEVPEKSGEPWWDRTTDPLLKSETPRQPENTSEDLSAQESDDQS